MPASCANAFAPTTALFGGTVTPVIEESNRLSDRCFSSMMFVRRAEVALPHVQRYRDFFQRSVSRALADAVDRALDLPRASCDRGQRIRHGQAQIVVAVRAQNHVRICRQMIARTRGTYLPYSSGIA